MHYASKVLPPPSFLVNIYHVLSCLSCFVILILGYRATAVTDIVTGATAAVGDATNIAALVDETANELPPGTTAWPLLTSHDKPC